MKNSNSHPVFLPSLLSVLLCHLSHGQQRQRRITPPKLQRCSWRSVCSGAKKSITTWAWCSKLSLRVRQRFPPWNWHLTSRKRDISERSLSCADSRCRVCPDGWLWWRSRCYFFSVGLQENRQWNESAEFCRKHNSSLVVIKDSGEMVTRRRRLWGSTAHREMSRDHTGDKKNTSLSQLTWRSCDRK